MGAFLLEEDPIMGIYSFLLTVAQVMHDIYKAVWVRCNKEEPLQTFGR